MSIPNDVMLSYIALKNSSDAANKLFTRKGYVEKPKESRHLKKREKQTRERVIQPMKRCIAFTGTNEQCKCSKSYGSDYCFTHIKKNDPAKYEEIQQQKIEQKEQKEQNEQKQTEEPITPWYKKLIPKLFI